MSPQIHFLIATSVWTWLRHLGGVGLVLLGLADSSVVPLPGSMDVLTIYLAARHRQLWWYYAVMATVGAVLGGYITYSLARKGGKEAFERKLSSKKAAKVFERFERWGFGAVAVPALLPPPFPDCAISAGGGRHAVFPQEVFGCAGLGPRGSLHDCCRPGSDLWQAHRPLLLPILQTGHVCPDRTCGHRRGSGSGPVLPVQAWNDRTRAAALRFVRRLPNAQRLRAFGFRVWSLRFRPLESLQRFESCP